MNEVEIHPLSCPFCNKNINAKGKMPNGNNMSSLQNLAKCEKPLEYKERIEKKGISDKIVAST